MDFRFQSREKDRDRIWKIQRGSRRPFVTSLIKYTVHKLGTERKTPGIWLCMVVVFFFCFYFFALAHTALQMNQENRHLAPFSLLEMLILLRNECLPPS